MESISFSEIFSIANNSSVAFFSLNLYLNSVLENGFTVVDRLKSDLKHS